MGFEKKVDKLIEKFPSQDRTEFIPSGSVVFDALYGGGIPKGLFIEIASDAGLGKSSAVLHFCKTACALGKKVVYLDFEKGVNESQINGMGLDKYLNENFLFLQPHTFEDGEEILNTLADEKDLAYVVIDSVTAMVPEKLLSKSISDSEPGLQARYTSLFLQKYKAVAKQNNITFFFINQMRYKLDFSFRGSSRKEAAGGFAQKFYMDIRTEMSSQKKLMRKANTMDGEQEVPYGAHVKVWTIKNRYERPFVPVFVTILFGKGISNLSTCFKWLEGKGYMSKDRVGWYTIKIGDKDERRRGEKEAMKYVKENIDTIKELIDKSGGLFLLSELEE